jgi:putative phosphoribosyl transferase
MDIIQFPATLKLISNSVFDSDPSSMPQSGDNAAESSHKSERFLKQPSQFPSLRAAGRELALRLESYRSSDAIVLGIALGGVPVAHEVATHLKAPLDLILIRRLLAPDGPGSQVCAINIAGSTIVDKGTSVSPAPATPLEHFIADALADLDRREQTCRRGRPPIAVEGRTVILVDCGVRSGLTMKAAIGALRQLRPRRIIGAVPVASPEGYASVVDLVDEMVCLAEREKFGNVAVWYRDFSRPGEEHVGDLLD